MGTSPTQDIPAIGSVKAQGFNVTAIPTWGFDYIIPNQANPQVGPILSQSYMRQVLEHLVDQNTMIQHFMAGYGTPTYGPTPIFPKGNPFVSASELTNPYPYSISGAEKLLKAHGWQVNPGKVDVCEKPGPAGCGAGVTKGEKLSLNLLYSSGQAILQEDTDLFQSDAAQAGVQINPKAEVFNTVISQVQPCVMPKGKGTPTCNWQLGEYGGISLSTYPSGDGLLNYGRCLQRRPVLQLDARQLDQPEHRVQHAEHLQGLREPGREGRAMDLAASAGQHRGHAEEPHRLRADERVQRFLQLHPAAVLVFDQVVRAVPSSSKSGPI